MIFYDIFSLSVAQPLTVNTSQAGLFRLDYRDDGSVPRVLPVFLVFVSCCFNVLLRLDCRRDL